MYQCIRRRLPQEFFLHSRPVNKKCVFINEREVTQDFHLLPGSYVIIPSTAEPDQECEFILRVFSRKHLLEEHGENPSPVLCCKKIAEKQDEQETVIARYFEKHPEINVSQLQMLLNKGSWTCAKQAPVKFSLDACKVIMAQLDVSASGTLNVIEFHNLWKRLQSYHRTGNDENFELLLLSVSLKRFTPFFCPDHSHWIKIDKRYFDIQNIIFVVRTEIFQRTDIDRSGFLNLSDLQAAVQEKGITLSHQFYNLIALRYGNSSLKINFENFVCLMLRMEINGGSHTLRRTLSLPPASRSSGHSSTSRYPTLYYRHRPPAVQKKQLDAHESGTNVQSLRSSLISEEPCSDTQITNQQLLLHFQLH
ncbi:hypothetical protein AB205_0132150 [Aquarana catesbeiana]|uniref:EF-hand domain-containing protein n=1 Tax=Aquarana catesbeiana TaxID=8400 RepID=A0A2G9S342_AQUCT|nr:hypothetical protein AB205_0132150 [Aquarana catesbeiana]